MRTTTTTLLALLLAGAAAAPARAQCTPDSFEDNDSCGAPATLSPGNGNYLGLNVSQLDPDYYRMTLAPGNELQVLLQFQHNLGDIDLYVYDAGCSTILASSTSTSDDEAIAFTNTTSAFVDLTIRVHLYAPNPDVTCPSYDMIVGVIDSLCGSDDGFEENDTCATARGVIPGYYIGLETFGSDPDFYRVTVPAGEALYAGLAFAHSLGDIDLRLHAPGCGGVLASSTSTTDDEELEWVNPGPGDADVIVEVYLYSGICNSYQMTLEVYEALCAGGSDDFLEDNDDCASATSIGAGTLAGLVATNFDWDWFRVSVPDGGTLTMTAQFAHAAGDIDLALYDACGGSIVAASGSVTDDEQVSLTNTTGATHEYFLAVYVYLTGQGYDCNTYDLLTSVTSGLPGTTYCASNPNSTGAAATIGATGSNSVSANDLVLVADDLPPGQFGIFFYGAAQQQVPFGNHGYLCVAEPVYRLLPRVMSTPGGQITHALDVTNPPQPSALISAGSTWNFQAWYRDPGFGFNLSNGYTVTFVP